jgi:putative thioredoxin
MIDATLATFGRDVLEASREAPVLVDFWAPWCGPCRVLGPALEKLELEYGGRWKLVKVNSDENPELSAQFQVRSIPFVVAFRDGKPAAQFLGAQPEGALRAFIDRLIPSPTQFEHRKAREALALGNAPLAEGHLKGALALDPSNDAARLDLAALALDRGDRVEARRQFDALTGKAELESTFEPMRARLEAAERAASLPPVEALERRVAADPTDLQARLDLAERHIAGNAYAPALEQLLEIVRRDRKFGDDIGRNKMLAVFDMGADPDLVSEYRRKLSSALY